MMDNKDIIKLGKTEESRPLVVGNDVFEKDLATSHLYRFKRNKYIFLNLLHDGLTNEEASLKAGLAPEKAAEFKESPEAVAYLEMRELREIVAREAKDPDRWWVSAYLSEEGIKPMSKVNCELWKERGKRIQPCSEANPAPTKIEIHISPDALLRSKEHRKFVETQIEGDLQHAV